MVTQEILSSHVFLSILKKIRQGETIPCSQRNGKHCTAGASPVGPGPTVCSTFNHKLILRLVGFSGVLAVISQRFECDSLETNKSNC